MKFILLVNVFVICFTPGFAQSDSKTYFYTKDQLSSLVKINGTDFTSVWKYDSSQDFTYRLQKGTMRPMNDSIYFVEVNSYLSISCSPDFYLVEGREPATELRSQGMMTLDKSLAKVFSNAKIYTSNPKEEMLASISMEDYQIDTVETRFYFSIENTLSKWLNKAAHFQLDLIDMITEEKLALPICGICRYQFLVMREPYTKQVVMRKTSIYDANERLSLKLRN